MVKNTISKVAVIGCSVDGDEVAKDIVGKLNLGEKSSIILIPHICAKSMYDYLKSNKKKKVFPILNNQIIEPQSIYVGMENPTDLLNSDNYYGLRRKLIIGKDNGEYKFFLDENKVAYIDSAFSAVANAFKDKSIGVILYGMGGSGIEGTTKIKKAGGTNLVQAVDETNHHFKASMPYAVIHHGEADHVLPVDKLGTKLEEMLR